MPTEFVPAPRYPFEAPWPTDRAGFTAPLGEHYCVECCPLSIWYLDRRLPRGWRLIEHRPRAKTVSLCTRCRKEIR